jgi:hypothetical protein
MRCKVCEYRLWNLRSRQCPECGSPFRPSDYEFVGNSVAFCCPHCNQRYYGTGEKGHLLPIQFDCVGCGQHIHMDQMVLLPTDDVPEEHTEVEHNPWLDRGKRGRIKAWFSTVGQGMFMPVRLMRATPPGSSQGQAAWFMLLTNILYYAESGLMFAFIPLLMARAMAGAGGPGGVAVWALGTVLGLFVGILLVVAVVVSIWGLLTHGVLLLTGGVSLGISRTYQSLCYSAGANVLAAVPCLGVYLAPVAAIWWAISAVLMLKEGHNISGKRASLAVLPFPLLLLAATVGLIAWMFVSLSRMGPPVASVTMQNRAIVSYARQHAGQGPQHAIELVTNGSLASWQFVDANATQLSQVPIGNTTLDLFDTLPVSQQQIEVQAAIAQLPPDTIAHRLGDYVFVHHGINIHTADPQLWLVIASPDPSANPAFSGVIEIGLRNGQTEYHPQQLFSAELQNQNTLRAAAGLAPLPDPATVLHSQPATGTSAVQPPLLPQSSQPAAP